MSLFKPAWMKDNEEAAIRAIQREKNPNRLNLAAGAAPSYRVRAIAFEKLGRLHEAKFEIALRSPDEATCLAALDGVDWDGWDQSLGTIALNSRSEAVGIKALSMIRDDDVLADVACKTIKWVIDSEPHAWAVSDFDAVKTTKKRISAEAFARLKNPDALRRLIKKDGAEALPAQLRFEVGTQLKDRAVCVSALGSFVSSDGADQIPAVLAGVKDKDFLKKVVAQWLNTAQNPLEISDKLKGKAVVTPQVASDLGDFFCPDGHLHEIEANSYILHADTDRCYGVIKCTRCAYKYRINGSVRLSGKNCGYMYRKNRP